jgi:hypothetical protein
MRGVKDDCAFVSSANPSFPLITKQTTRNKQTKNSGWRFDGSGRCTAIPQIGDAEAAAAATAAPRACLQTFPTRMQGDLLFVWLESGPAAEAEAAATPVRARGGPPSFENTPLFAAALAACQSAHHPPQNPLLSYPPTSKLSTTTKHPFKKNQIAVPGGVDAAPGTFFMSEAPIDWPMWLEQGMDPSHGPFLHDGIGGMSMGASAPMPAERLPLAKVGVRSGFQWVHGGYMQRCVSPSAVLLFVVFVLVFAGGGGLIRLRVTRGGFKQSLAPSLLPLFPPNKTKKVRRHARRAHVFAAQRVWHRLRPRLPWSYGHLRHARQAGADARVC